MSTSQTPTCQGLSFDSSDPSHVHAVFLPHVLKFAEDIPRGARVLDVGCGNGFACGEFLKREFAVVGIDASETGIDLARKTYPSGRFETLPVADDILQALGEQPFDLVISTEVVEHVYSPRAYARACHAALKPGGRFICTTPYHGYFKNLALSLLGSWDQHADPLWEGGHIKFWSVKTLTRLLTEAGFTNIRFRGAGRVPYLWMTMVVSADKPAQSHAGGVPGK